MCQVFEHQSVLKGAAQWVERGEGFPLPSQISPSEQFDVNEIAQW